jgi:hypothetical protein
MSGFAGNSASDGAYEKPLGGAGDAQCVVAFARVGLR